MQRHIILQSSDMGTMFRESRSGLASLMEKEGYDYQVYQKMIDSYENALFELNKDSKEE